MNLRRIGVFSLGLLTMGMFACSSARVVDYNTALAHVQYYYTNDEGKGTGTVTNYQWDFSKTTGDGHLTIIKNFLRTKHGSEELIGSNTDSETPFSYSYVTYRTFKTKYKNEQAAKDVNAVFTIDGLKLSVTADTTYSFEGSTKEFIIRQSEYLDDKGLLTQIKYEFNNCHDDELGEGYITGWMIETPTYTSR